MKKPINSTDAILQTVIIQTGQLKTMADFYAHGLKLGESAATGADHLGFPLPNLYFGFDQVEGAPAPSGVVSLWFEVDDIEATFKRFAESGAKVSYPPTKNPGVRFSPRSTIQMGTCLGFPSVEPTRFDLYAISWKWIRYICS